MAAQALVVAAGAVTFVVAALLVAPALFREHLARTGESDPSVRLHAEEAFVTAFAVALVVGTLAALLAAGAVSWFLARRVSAPVVALADAADAVAAGSFQLEVPNADFAVELQRLSEAFGQMAGRLAATEANRSRMLGDLAHEIRTPLATLEAYIDGVEDGVVPPGEATWGTMRSQVGRLRRLTEDLREVAAAEEHALGLVMRPVDIVEIAAAAVAAAAPAFRGKGVDLALDGSPDTVVVQADPERIGQVLANLLGNALRHTPNGGTVRAVIESDARGARIMVVDTGDGIPADELDAIFERFHRADPARSGGTSGSGLGLTIARAIVTEHGGTLTAWSAGPGQGATLTMTLPTGTATVRPDSARGS